MMGEIVEGSAVKRRRRPPAAATFGPHGPETELPRVGSVKRKQMLDALDLYAQARF